MSHYDDMMRRVMDDATRRPPDPVGWTRIAELEHRLGLLIDLAQQKRHLVDGSWMVRADDVDAIAKGLYDQ